MAEKLDDKAIFAARRKRSIALGIVLALLVVAIYALTFDKGGALFNRGL